MWFRPIIHISRSVIWDFRGTRPEVTQLKMRDFFRSCSLRPEHIWECIRRAHTPEIPLFALGLVQVSLSPSRRLASETPRTIAIVCDPHFLITYPSRLR